MKMFKKKAMTSFVAVVTASILVASGCGSDEDNGTAGDGDGDGDATGGTAGDGDGDATGGTSGGVVDLSDCEGFCDATADADCATRDACMAACGGLEVLCADGLSDYLGCGADKTSVVCVDDQPVGLIPGCQAEAQALLVCFSGIGGAGGDGGAGGGTP